MPGRRQAVSTVPGEVMKKTYFCGKQKLTVDFCEGRKIAWCEPELGDYIFQIGGW